MSRFDMLWLLLACTSTPPELMALDVDVSLEDAMTACAKLPTPVRQGRCSLDALNIRGAVTADGCASVSGERWHSECMFQAAEQSSGTLAERYSMCQRAGEYTRECGFHLWQKDLMDLKPGDEENEPGILDRAGQLMREHRGYAEPIDRSFEQTFWTWFWGAWWEQQPAHAPTDLSACGRWAAPEARAECERWAAPAHAWTQTRETKRPR
jgi:hypothetical protein